MLAEHFDADEIYIVGSQALLVHRADVHRKLRFSGEIDAYVSRTGAEAVSSEEASHEINALFGEGSSFHAQHGFFIDGVDESTATLPPNWRDNAIRRPLKLASGRTVTLIAPSIPDLISAKLARGDSKDIEFASLCLAGGLAKKRLVEESIGSAMHGEQARAALKRLDAAALRQRDALAAARAEMTESKDRETSLLEDVEALAAIQRLLANRDV